MDGSTKSVQTKDTTAAALFEETKQNAPPVLLGAANQIPPAAPIASIAPTAAPAPTEGPAPASTASTAPAPTAAPASSASIAPTAPTAPAARTQEQKLDVPDLPHNLLENWSVDSNTRVVYGKFESESIQQDDIKTLLSMLDRQDIFVVTEGMVNVKIDDDGADFVKKILQFQKKEHKDKPIYLYRFDSQLEGNNVVTTEKTGMFLKIPEVIEYFEKRKTFLNEYGYWASERLEDDDEALHTFSNNGQIHLGRVSPYLVNFDISQNNFCQRHLSKAQST